jgi:hypothetical protein
MPTDFSPKAPKTRAASQKNSHTKILLAVSGMTPQIITETLYALHF